jgi:hypothetical protein
MQVSSGCSQFAINSARGGGTAPGERVVGLIRLCERDFASRHGDAERARERRETRRYLIHYLSNILTQLLVHNRITLVCKYDTHNMDEACACDDDVNELFN